MYVSDEIRMIIIILNKVFKLNVKPSWNFV